MARRSAASAPAKSSLCLRATPEVVEGLRVVGMGRGQLAVDGGRAFDVALLHERAAQVVPRGGVGRVLGEHGPERGQRLLRLALRHQHQAQRVARVGEARIEGEALGQHGGGAVQVAPFAQGVAEARVGGREGRIERDGAAELDTAAGRSPVRCRDRPR